MESPLFAPFLPPQFNPEALDPLARQFAHKQSSLFRVYEVVNRLVADDLHGQRQNAATRAVA